MRATRVVPSRRGLFYAAFEVIAIGAVVGMCLADGSASGEGPGSAANQGAGASSTESSVIARTNEARAKRGLAPLTADAALMNGARRQAAWMARNRNLSHGQGVTENIAMGQASAAEVVADWMRSDGHRANILGSHSRIGVAMARAADGTVYWCQQFR